MRGRVMTKQQGAGLIEVLIALLVLAIGLLGLGALQTQSLKFNNESYFRTQATLLAMDMADRLRANKAYARSAPSAYTFTASDQSAVALDACQTGVCAPGALAQYDFKQWRDRVELALPGGQVTLTPDTSATATLWRDYAIQISYRAPDSTSPQVFIYRVRI